MVNATYEALLLEGAMTPPPGLTSDFVNTGANHGLGYGLVIGTTIVAGVSVAARLISSTIAKKFEIEDVLMVVALVSESTQRSLVSDTCVEYQMLIAIVGYTWR
jgi:hypothetical protein